jgi:hypothetical protein
VNWNSEPYGFNDVVRSLLFATRIGQLQGVAHDAEIVAGKPTAA